MHAEFTYDGSAASAVVGSTPGLLLFVVTRLEDGMTFGGDNGLDCREYVLKRGQPRSVPFIKSGGYGVQGPEPAFYRKWLGDPLLRLPHGTWSVTALGYLDTGGCSGSDERTPIRATITLRVQ